MSHAYWLVFSLAALLVLGSSASAEAAPYSLGAYVEAYYQWNFDRPDNGVTHYRGFDNRHDSITLANVALDAQWDYEDLVGRLTLQVGSTPSTYYASEPSLAAAPGANGSSAELWKYLQQAYTGYRFDVGRGLTTSAGLFLSPIGPESMAVKDNWNWSRSTLFFALPFYHTGARASYALSDTWTCTLAVYNGWNSVLDNNAHKSLSAQASYVSARWSGSWLYFGGVERARGAIEGAPFRHLLDGHVTFHAHPRLSLMGHLNGGIEPSRLGKSAWFGGALYARAKLLDVLFLAVRADVLRELVAADAGERAAPIFFPSAWLGAGTATLDYRPHARVSLRLEFRHDHAHGALFYGRTSAQGGEFVADRRSQDTLTVGATSWF